MITRENFENLLKDVVEKNTQALLELVKNTACDKNSGYENIEDCICSLSNNVKKWENVDVSTQTKVYDNFSIPSNFGKILGYIDSGLLRKGRNGILFFQNGLVTKPMLSSNLYSIDYETICKGIIADSNEYIVADYKFKTNKNGIISKTSAAPCIGEMLRIIRTYLVHADDNYRQLWISKWVELVDVICTNIYDKNYNEAVNQSEVLVAFAQSSNDKIFQSTTYINALCMLLNGDVDNINLGDSDNSTELNDLINKYHVMRCGEYMDFANAYLEEGESEKAFDSAKKAIDSYSHIDAWRVYMRIILSTANEDNFFNMSELNKIESSDDYGKEERNQIKEEFKSEIQELYNKLDHYKEMLSAIYVQKIQENDTSFFDSHPELTEAGDCYEMTPCMYAALLKNEKMIDYFGCTELNKKNMLGHTVVDILTYGYFPNILKDKSNSLHYFFSSQNKENYKWFKHDKWFWLNIKCLPNDNNAILEKIFDGGLNLIEARSYQAIKDLERANVQDDDFYEKVDRAISAKDALERNAKIRFEREERERQRQQERIDKMKEIAAESYKHYRNIYRKVQNDVLTNACDVKEIGIKDAYTKFISAEREKFVKAYLSDKLAPKGEFEKTTQYEERYKSALNKANEEFESNAESHKKTFEELEKAKTELAKKRHSLALKYLTNMGENQQFVLGKYDADNETFQIIGNNATHYINVPINIASDFKNSFSNDFIYHIKEIHVINKENSFVISWRFAAEHQGKLYSWNSQKTVLLKNYGNKK